MGPLRWGAATAVLLCASPALAQQGSIQVSTSTQITTGDPLRRGAMHTLEPDVGLTVFQPGLRFGTLELDLHVTRRWDLPHVGRAAFALRDVKAKGLTWSVEGGDAQLTAALSEYGFSNLFAPPVSFNGLGVSGVGRRASIRAAAGRVTALRNIFGSDPETLDQTIAVVQASVRPHARLELVGRGARVRTLDLEEFTYFVESSVDAGAGVRVLVTPSLQLVADGGLTRFRRRGAPDAERRPSWLAGARWAGAHGWLQINAQHFPAGQFPVVNFTLNDSEGLFAAGEYDLFSILRLFGGWQALRTNVHPDAAEQGLVARPEGTAERAFGGLRMQVGGRAFLTVRVEEGDRTSRFARFSTGFASNTGVATAEWQSTFSRWNVFGRYERRENVDIGRQAATFTQHDASLHFYYSLPASTQVFGSGMFTRREGFNGDGHTFWQFSGGGQFRLPGQNLYLRAEALTSQQLDIASRRVAPRQALNVGLSGQLTPRTSVGLDVFVDRAPLDFAEASPWLTRSMVRLTRSFPTGAARAVSGPATGERARRIGSVAGLAFVDWNANGVPDPGEEAAGGIVFTLGGLGTVTTGELGRFQFVGVPAGPQTVALDTTQLPVSYDAPSEPTLNVDVRHNEAVEVAFGVIPLGTIQGGVYHDANRTGKLDEGDQPLDEAVVILDEGARSELVRQGRYRFDAVRAGRHTVQLLAETLPDGSTISGDATLPAEMDRSHMTVDATFLVNVEKRPEIRRVFPARPPAAAGRAPDAPPRQPQARGAPGRAAVPPASPARPSAQAARRAASRTTPVTAVAPAAYAIQVAALRSPRLVDALIHRLTSRGHPVILVPPGAGAEPPLYRVRVGPFETRNAALEAAAGLERDEGLKGWITAR